MQNELFQSVKFAYFAALLFSSSILILQLITVNYFIEASSSFVLYVTA